MSDPLASLESQSWPTLEGRTLTHGCAFAVVSSLVGLAAFAAGTDPALPFGLLGVGVATLAASASWVWSVPTRRADFEEGLFEFGTPLGGSGTDFQVGFEDVLGLELAIRRVHRRKSRDFRYWTLRARTKHHVDPYRLESGDYGEFHRLLAIGRALRDELDVDLDIEPTMLEPTQLRRDSEFAWWSLPHVRPGMFSLVILSSVVGCVVAAAKGAIPPTAMVVLIGVALSSGAGGFYLFGRYCYPDQMGRHTISLQQPDQVEISSLNPLFGSRRYAVDELDAIAIRDGLDPAVLFVEEDATRVLALRDGAHAGELADLLRASFASGAADRDDVPDNPTDSPESMGW